MRKLAANECLIQCGWIGARREDGTVERTEAIYRIVTQDEAPNGLTRIDRQCCEDIAATLGKKFGEYWQSLER